MPKAADQRLTRRTLIGASAAAAGAAALPQAAEAKPKQGRRAPRRVDVIVVGAGLSGLSAARSILGAGRSVLVLEARKRVGGRTLNHSLGHGKVVEVGGQWIGPTQDHIAALAHELGVGTYKTYNSGNYLFYESGHLTPYTPNGPFGAVPPDYTAAGQLENVLIDLDKKSKSVPLSAPWTASNAVSWDSQTFETYKQGHTLGSGASNLLDLGIESVWACEPRDVSLLHVLFYVHSAGNERQTGTFERLINTAGGAQESRFIGGSQLVSIRAAKRLGKGRVLLSHPVRRINQNRRGVTVHSDKHAFHAKAVIVTGPPSLTGLIHYEPALPIARAQLLQRFPQGSAIKCEAVYPRPFWRDHGLAGQVTSDTGPIKITFDNSPPDGKPGVLLGFVEGHDARVFGSLSPAQRRAQAIACFVRYFGAQAAHPSGYIEMNWSAEPWTRGCYVGYTPPGVLLDYGHAIRAPFGRIHWAGAETSDYWNGYMDGAVRSGQRAASEVLSSI
ncbi:MAG: flavin monoamine oxidase family protein [Solirubrobacterales bacterium]|nr:flavin monoamine oxidase family protein [Solirubrobacterales bacterium]